ncbi:Tetratricopeptide repeat protein [anaerobic digester metagenome]
MTDMRRIAPVLMVITVIGIIIPCSGVDFGLPAIEGLNVTNVTEIEKEGFKAINEQNWDRLLSISQSGLEQGLEDPVLFTMKGYALRKLGDSQNALIADSRAIEIQPNPVRYENRAMTHLSLGNYSAALSDAQNALSLKSDYGTAYATKALAFSFLGNNTAATENIDQAFLFMPDNAAILHIAGIVEMNNGNCSAAIAYFERSLAENAEYSLPWPAMPNATIDLEIARNKCS